MWGEAGNLRSHGQGGLSDKVTLANSLKEAENVGTEARSTLDGAAAGVCSGGSQEPAALERSHGGGGGFRRFAGGAEG